MKARIYALFTAILMVASCSQKEKIDSGISVMQDCKALAPFITRLGFPANSTAFSTTEKKLAGVAIVDIKTGQTFQDATWIDKGNFGPLAIDEGGNAYLAPIPFVNVLDAIRRNQNIIYKVDAQTGKMNPLIKLGDQDSVLNSQNPYGVMGLFYDCESHLLYASSVHGSTKDAERGTIYCIDGQTGKIVDQYKGVDAAGVGVAYFNEKKYLFFGNARDHGIYRVALKENGGFSDKKIFCFSLEGEGPRGDDIARKIRFNKNNEMEIFGFEFYYNLTAPTEKQETKYKFVYNLNTESWQMMK